MLQLPADCLDNILENLDDDRYTLHSCVLVNHLWCEISVRIFWRNGYNYNISNFKTLVFCLPNESKEILSKNGITIVTPTTKFPTFNYASFCKLFSVNRVQRKIETLLSNEQTISPQILEDNTNIVVQEICKMFMNQISSLKGLDLFIYKGMKAPIFILYPKAKDCLKNLSVLYCHSDISSEIFYQLSQICHNISTLHIVGRCCISNRLADLIFVQKNLKHFILSQRSDSRLLDYSSLVTKLSNTLIKLNLYEHNYVSLSFIAKFSNLQELRLSLEDKEDYVNFEKLSYASFSQLKILKFRYSRPDNESLARFLENNGKNLNELYISFENSSYNNNSLNSVISKFCTNLRKFSGGFKSNELEMLELILKNCKYLKSIEIFCGGKLLSEKEALSEVVKYSHENISEIILRHYFCTQPEKLLPKELEALIVSLANYVPRRSLSLVIVTNDYCKMSLDKNEKNIKVIKKYIDLGVIKNFKIRGYDDEFN
ncbi:hypothetical protein RclHR1_07660008 [Rhizophagus clarus]|uniref:F-box domain-containing protein n=1 Tax=Rhizophagus clarus TaxID=94130 RepID=A0A2Z6SDL4_9GLOM|nr:hypothetical protein RclHR1_07660008 [Rhizophagus clarus]GES74652.1 hypothetical protein GLOIN_2v1784405 [Rhizophagus clarus]